MEVLKCARRLSRKSKGVCGSTKNVTLFKNRATTLLTCSDCKDRILELRDKNSKLYYKKLPTETISQWSKNGAKNIKLFKEGKEVNCMSLRCKTKSSLAKKIFQNLVYCLECYEEKSTDSQLRKQFIYSVNKALVQNGVEICYSCGSVASNISKKNSPSPICSNCHSKELEEYNNAIRLRKITDEDYVIQRKLSAQKANIVRTQKKLTSLQNTLEITKMFNPKINFGINNVREELVREVIFDTIENLVGIKWKNEKFLALTTNTAKAIDVYVPEYNLFIEYKNTCHTQNPAEFREEMESHFDWINNSPYKGASLISVSTNGSMCDYNILQFLCLILIALRKKYRKRPSKSSAKKINGLKALIKKLIANRHLFEDNVWPDLLTDKIITKMLEKRAAPPTPNP